MCVKQYIHTSLHFIPSYSGKRKKIRFFPFSRFVHVSLLFGVLEWVDGSVRGWWLLAVRLGFSSSFYIPQKGVMRKGCDGMAWSYYFRQVFYLFILFFFSFRRRICRWCGVRFCLLGMMFGVCLVSMTGYFIQGG